MSLRLGLMRTVVEVFAVTPTSRGAVASVYYTGKKGSVFCSHGHKSFTVLLGSGTRFCCLQLPSNYCTGKIEPGASEPASGNSLT